MSLYDGRTPHLDARLVGFGDFTCTPGLSTHEYVFSYDCQFNGLKYYAWDSNPKDKITRFETQYNAGPYGWKRYKKFGKNWPIFPNLEETLVLFTTEPSAGIRLFFEYQNNGVEDVILSMGGFTYVELAELNPSILQEGEDW